MIPSFKFQKKRKTISTWYRISSSVNLLGLLYVFLKAVYAGLEPATAFALSGVTGQHPNQLNEYTIKKVSSWNYTKLLPVKSGASYLKA